MDEKSAACFLNNREREPVKAQKGTGKKSNSRAAHHEPPSCFRSGHAIGTPILPPARSTPIFSAPNVNKKSLIAKIISQLTQELEIYYKAARAAHAEATHEQSKAENKYDTRGLEASYLARGQSRQAAEIEQAIKQFEVLEIRSFGEADPIDVGALVELENGSEHSFYFIASRAGGTEIVSGKKSVLVITPQSPLGQQLVGRKQDDCLQMTIAGARSEYRIVSVS
jgi:transcription elongation GreA/GreB family factor